MKKIFLLALLAIVSVSAFARKSYITVTAHPYSGSDSWNMYLSGDVPNNIAHLTYMGDTYHYWQSCSYYSIGEMLNILSGYGYEVEFTTSVSDNSYSKVQYVLSKEVPSNQTVSSGDVNKDGKINVSDITTLVNIILGIVRDNPSLLELSR